MKALLSISVLIALSIASPLMAQPMSAQDVQTMNAAVLGVDLTNRTLTLMGRMGRVVTFNVDPHVSYFAMINVGDQITLQYAEALSLKLEKRVAGGGPGGAAAGPFAAAGSVKPRRMRGQPVAIVANIENIDPVRNDVLLLGPQGRYIEVKVSDPAVLQALQIGDKVQVTFTEAVIVGVMPNAAANALP